MKKGLFFAFLVAAIAFFSVDLAAQANKNAEVKRIDALCKKIDASRKRAKSPDLVVADTADINSKRSKWRKFASEKALEKFRTRNETYTIAYNWKQDGKIVGSNFTHFSPSGDWAKYIFHYFRADGTLAYVETDYRTFMGNFKVIRGHYFDVKGKQIKSTARFLDLRSGKPKKHKGGVDGDDPKEVDYYKKTSKLPFAHLLGK